MKNKKILILFILFIALGFAVWLQEQSVERKAEYSPFEIGLLFPELDPNRITSIVLGSFGGDVTISKENDNWLVEDEGQPYPADMESIDRIFGTTSELESIQVVSRNPDNHIDFQVNVPMESHITDDNGETRAFTMGTMGTEVQLYYDDGTEAAHFFVGKNGSMDFMTTYVRKADSDTVLLAPGYLKMIYGKGDATAWKDLMVCSITPEQIASITVRQNDGAFVLEHVIVTDDETGAQDMVWMMTEPDRGRVDSANMQKLTTLLRHFRATDFADVQEDPAQYGFEEPAAVVSVQMKDSDEVKTLIFGNKTEEKANQHYFKVKGDDKVYLVPNFRLESVPLTPDDLFPA